MVLSKTSGGAMGDMLPVRVQELLKRPILAHVATLMRDGSPQVTPVWVDTDGEYVIINTVEGNVKARNLLRDPRVAISVVDPSNAHRMSLQVRGEVVAITREGADDHINRMAKKYTGAELYARRRVEEVRLLVWIRPDRLSGGATRTAT
jgi:PPOX class probable F420-dependent enzyme